MVKRKRKFNTPLAKSAIMFTLGAVVGAIGGVSGIGMQIAAAPILAFMLGYAPDKSLGTAAALGLFTAAGAAVGATLGGAAPMIAPAAILWISATVGAIAGVRFAVSPKLKTAQLIAGTVTMAVLVFMIGGAVRSHAIGVAAPMLPFFATASGYALIGLISGLLSGSLQIASGVLFVPALHYLCGLPPVTAVATSLLVVAIASLLPAAIHSTQGRVESGAGLSMIFGGAIGGLAGGYLLAGLVHVYSPAIPLLSFALVAMFIGGWQASRRA